MIYLGLNDCYPATTSNEEIITNLESTFRGYATLRQKFPNDIDGILTPKSAETLAMNKSGLSLAASIDYLTPSYRRLALIAFNKYDIETYIPITDADVEEIINRDPYFLFDEGARFNGINARIINLHGGILFSIPVSPKIALNELTFHSNDEVYFTNSNLFGGETNITFIEEYVTNRINSGLQTFERLEKLIPNQTRTSRFKKDFMTLSLEMQEVVLDHLGKAIRRQGPTKLYPDGDLIKDVSPEKAKNGVYELRIFKPKALRMYFYEVGDHVYLSSIENKPNPASQNNHIKTANDNIDELILMR